MHADAGVGGTGAPGNETHARAARKAAVGAGHEGAAAFLTAGHSFDLGRVVQCIEHRKEALARDSKYAVASLFDQAVDKKAATGDSVIARGSLGHAQGLTSDWPVSNQLVSNWAISKLDTVPDWERRISGLDDG
jgi:hypothetical protein